MRAPKPNKAIRSTDVTSEQERRIRDKIRKEELDKVLALEAENADLETDLKKRERRLSEMEAAVVPAQKSVSVFKPMLGMAVITGTVCVGLCAADLAYRAVLKKTGLANIS